MIEIPWLLPLRPDDFPPLEQALDDPNGLLAMGGDLSINRLLAAYRRGIFPWFEEGQPILWWSPDPRMVLFPAEFRLHRSLRKVLRNRGWEIRFDTNFQAVIEACAEQPRPGQSGTWITDDMQRAYHMLHLAGHAHSVEVYDPDHRLIGGLYGVAIGRAFFGESMFSRVPDASKAGFATLVCHLQQWGFGLIDCQMETEHLASLGARAIPRRDFAELLDHYCELPGPEGRWQVDPALPVDRWLPEHGEFRARQ
ncbi:MAG: leucyl/phenylalanyl-tRNA--protein transferase [Gammaproteobacteria bacterium]|nr:MAG: leucyl/phenylalanyl-tRNA--protein transferase [Gammaproteobacteria bacterium]